VAGTMVAGWRTCDGLAFSSQSTTDKPEYVSCVSCHARYLTTVTVALAA